MISSQKLGVPVLMQHSVCSKKVLSYQSAIRIPAYRALAGPNLR